MKGISAFLAQMGIAALQVAAAAPMLDNSHPKNALANVGIQIAAQAGLSVLHGVVAQKNSKSDPNGNKLAETSPGHFETSHPLPTPTPAK